MDEKQTSKTNGEKPAVQNLAAGRDFPFDRWQLPFFTIWTVQAVSLLGSQLVQFALIWYLTVETGSATVLALASLVGMGPQVLLGPVIGTLVDRWNRRLVMIAADAMVALATVVLAVLFFSGQVQIWHIYALMFVRSLAGSFHWPAMTASTSLMVPKVQLSRIQGLNQLLQGGLTIVAAPMGALLLEVLPMQGILAIDIATAALAISPLLFIPIPQPKAAAAAGAKAASVWQDLKAGVKYTVSWPGLLILMISATLINMVLSVAFTLAPILVSQHFGGGALQLGWFESALGVGMLLGGLLLSIWGGFKRRIYTSLGGLIVMGLAAISLGLVPGSLLTLAIGIAFVLGLALPLVNGPVHAVLQAVVAPEMQGRVFTLLQSAATAMMPIGLIVAGPVADRFGVQIWYLVGGLVTAVVGIAGFFIPAFREIEEQKAAPDVPDLPDESRQSGEPVHAAGAAPLELPVFSEEP